MPKMHQKIRQEMYVTLKVFGSLHLGPTVVTFVVVVVVVHSVYTYCRVLLTLLQSVVTLL